MSLDEQLSLIRSRLSAEEQLGPAGGLHDLARRREERQAIERQLSLLVREIRPLTRRYKQLPALPDLKQVRWAQSVLAFPNARLMSVDHDATAPSPAILRILLMDFAGAVRFDRFLAPASALSPNARSDLGITAHDLGAASLPQVWPALVRALQGKYIVSYDLDRLLRALEDNAKQCELDQPVIIGDCLLRHCLHYFQDSGFSGLASLCRLVGHPLPEPPDQMAVARALGLLRLLQAMAGGIAWDGRYLAAPAMPGGREDDPFEC